MNSITRQRVAQLLETRQANDLWSHRLDIALTLLITLNLIAIILESVPQFEARYGTAFLLFEYLSVALFALEYGLRVWSIVDAPAVTDRRPFWGRLRYAITPYALIDLLAILPSLLLLFIDLDLRFLRVLRLLRLLKFSRYSLAIQALLDALYAERQSLGAAFFLLFVLFLLASSGIYLLEQQAQPDDFGSIPAAMWWATATLTTVGYGDVVPHTVWGKVFGGCITIIGVGMVALPAGIIASGFSERLRLRRVDCNYLLGVALSPTATLTERQLALAELSNFMNLNAEMTKRLDQALR